MKNYENRLPFTEDIIVGNEFMLGEINYTYYQEKGLISFEENGEGLFDNKKCQWMIEGGQLRVMSESYNFILKSIEVRNNELFYSGFNNAGSGVVMSIPRRISKDDFCILITSHYDYYEATLHNVLGSLEDADVNMDNVFCVVAGFPEDKPLEHEDVLTTPLEGGEFLHSSTAADKIKDFKYTFILHDTCVVDENFNSLISSWNEGFPFDAIGVSKEEGFGLFRTDLLLACHNEGSSKSFMDIYQTEIKSSATLKGSSRKYGSEMRHALYYPEMGLTKFKRQNVGGRRRP